MASHTTYPAKFANVIALSPKILNPFPPQLMSGTVSSTTEFKSTSTGEPAMENDKELSSCNGAGSMTKDGDEDSQNEVDDEELRELQTAYERRLEERKKAQDEAAMDRHRLEKILRICNEYDQQLEKEKGLHQKQSDEKRDSRSSWSSITKIKTNGSLTSPVFFNKRSDAIEKLCADDYPSSAKAEFGAQISAQPVDAGFVENVVSNGFRVKDEKLTLGVENKKIFELRNAFSLSNLSDEIDNDNVSTDCFLEESASIFSNDPSELSFQMSEVSQASPLVLCPMDRSDLYTRTFAGGCDVKGINYQKSGEVMSRIKVLRRRIIDVKELEEKTFSETQKELELLQWEYNTLVEQLRGKSDRMAAINNQQMELLFEAANEREEARKKLESERQKLEELETRLAETKKSCLSVGIDPGNEGAIKESGLEELILTEMENVEYQQRLFDDLEFHLLEMETRSEEEREPQQRRLAAELNQLKQSSNLIEETLLQLAVQKDGLVRQVKSDIVDLEKERLLLIEDFRKEKKKLSSILNKNGTVIKDNSFTQKPFLDAAKRPKPTDVKAADFKADEFCQTTPSSTKSVIQKLQELELRNAELLRGGGDKTGVSRSRNGGEDDFNEEEEEEEEDVSSNDFRLSQSSTFVDRLKSWLQGELEEQRYFGSDDEESTQSSTEDLRRMNFFASGRSSGSSTQHHRSDFELPNTGYHQPSMFGLNENSGHSNEVGVVGNWNQSAHASVDIRHLSPANTTEVVMRQCQQMQSRPMTRYLPVRGSDTLNLRSFIESSGHRLDGNPHIHVSSSSCRGFLVKMGTKFRLWHRRWFVFDRSQHSITYYSDQTSSKVRGCILFAAIEDVFVDHMRTVRSPSPKLTFCLKTSIKNYYLVAPSAETMRIWIDVLFTGAEAYQEFS